MTSRTFSIALPETLEAYVRERVAEDGYRSPADYLRALIREDQERHLRSDLDYKLLEGLESEPEPVTPEYLTELRREAQERIERCAAQAGPAGHPRSRRLRRSREPDRSSGAV